MGFRGHLKLYHVGSFDIMRKATSSRDVKPYIYIADSQGISAVSGDYMDGKRKTNFDFFKKFLSKN